MVEKETEEGEKTKRRFNWKIIFRQFENVLRIIVNHVLMIMVVWYLFTIDKDAKETSFVQVRSFTSMIVLINIDNILAPTAGIIFPKMKLFEHKSIFIKDGKKEEKKD